MHVHFFKSQRLNLIDKQIAESSDILANSEDFKNTIGTSSLLSASISRVLKSARIGKTFLLRDRDGKIFYESFNVGLLMLNLPISPEWVTAETETEFVRVRNVPLPDKGLILQVGLVVDRNFINWEILDKRAVSYIIAIVLALFVVSAGLTLVLLSPLRMLIGHLKQATSNLSNLKDVGPLPVRLKKYGQGAWAKSDELSSLLDVTQKLIDRINLNYKLTRSWTLQMAHELKTPLAIMHAETESERRARRVPEEHAQAVFREIEEMSEIISQFLDWAELESSQLQKNLHALRMKSVVRTVVSRLDKIRPGRIQMYSNSEDFPVVASPNHLDQLISNLVTNALKFSPDQAEVELTLTDHCLKIKDQGTGIPREVYERIGQPFNVGPYEGAVSGTGLGLAWVSTVAKLYQWRFEIKSTSEGTEAIVHFPVEDA